MVFKTPNFVYLYKWSKIKNYYFNFSAFIKSLVWHFKKITNKSPGILTIYGEKRVIPLRFPVFFFRHLSVSFHKPFERLSRKLPFLAPRVPPKKIVRMRESQHSFFLKCKSRTKKVHCKNNAFVAMKRAQNK